MIPNQNATERSISQAFVLGGNATFTVKSKTGSYHTYKVNAPKDQLETPVALRWYFAKALTGPDNESSYSYMGVLKQLEGNLLLTTKSRFARTDERVRVFVWAIERIWKSIPLPEGYSIMHAGKCGCCGRKLTTPASLAAGIGPECIKHFHQKYFD
jgi:hypothetical protein